MASEPWGRRAIQMEIVNPTAAWTQYFKQCQRVFVILRQVLDAPKMNYAWFSNQVNSLQPVPSRWVQCARKILIARHSIATKEFVSAISLLILHIWDAR
mmetsp:Transcript_25655/g.39434  ORF Transcript_25655/g.39434 Transcript_25655/m.39434 type:complete len:99 (-) Transcript_25655:427-723(-)